MSRAGKVLSGMRGTLWIDKDSFHIVRAEGRVVAPVPVYGILARLCPEPLSKSKSASDRFHLAGS